MKASLLYRIAAVLILLFAAGHTAGFLQHDPEWRVDALLASMRSIHFDIQGFSRSYWDFFVGFGFLVTVFLLFAAALAWQLAGMAAETPVRVRGVSWALALCFVAVAILSWRYFFILQIIFSTVIAVFLIVAAWLSSKTPQPQSGGD